MIKWLARRHIREAYRQGKNDAVCIRHPYVKPSPDAENVFCENCGWWICHSGLCANPDCTKSPIQA